MYYHTLKVLFSRLSPWTLYDERCSFMANGFDVRSCQWSSHDVYPPMHDNIPMHQIMFKNVAFHFSLVNWLQPLGCCLGSTNVVFSFLQILGVLHCRGVSLNYMFNFKPQILMTIEVKTTFGVDLSLSYDSSCLLGSIRGEECDCQGSSKQSIS